MYAQACSGWLLFFCDQINAQYLSGMKNRFLLNVICAIVAFGFHTVQAQQVYTSAHYSQPIDIHLFNRIQNPALLESLVTGGEEVVWDVSADSTLSTYVSSTLTPAAVTNQFAFLAACTALNGQSVPQCLSVWNAAGQTMLSDESLSLFEFELEDLQRHYGKTSDYLLEYFFGFTVDLGGTPTSAVIVYHQPDTVWQFPLQYGEAWTSSTSFGIDLAVVGQPITYASSLSRASAVDSWGTIVTPFATFENVIRLRADIQRDDVVTFDSLQIPVSFTQVEYLWFDTAYSMPVMMAQGVLTGGDTVVINSAGYIYDAICPEHMWSITSENVEYFVDSTGSVAVDFEITDPNASSYTWNFGDGSSAISNGNISHTYQAPGLYVIQVEGCMSDCLPVNSCAVQIYTIQVSDTLSSTHNHPGRLNGIEVYPNPVQSTLYVNLPASVDDVTYDLFDLAGRPLQQGRLAGGHTQPIAMQDLSLGMYLIKFRITSTGEVITRAVWLIR